MLFWFDVCKLLGTLSFVKDIQPLKFDLTGIPDSPLLSRRKAVRNLHLFISLASDNPLTCAVSSPQFYVRWIYHFVTLFFFVEVVVSGFARGRRE